MGILNPPDHPARFHLGADPPQARSDLGNILITLNQVAACAAYLLKDPLPLRQERRILKSLDIKVTGGTTRLNLGPAK